MGADVIHRDDGECFGILADMYYAGAAAVQEFTAQHQDRFSPGYACIMIPLSETDLVKVSGSTFSPHEHPSSFLMMVDCDRYQSGCAKYHVAKAMCKSLQSHGIDATCEQWVD